MRGGSLVLCRRLSFEIFYFLTAEMIGGFGECIESFVSVDVFGDEWGEGCEEGGEVCVGEG